MITGLKVSAGDLSIEVEGDGFDEICEMFVEALGNPDVRFKAVLPALAPVIDISTKKPRTCSRGEMRTPETEGNGKIPLVLDGKTVASATPSPRPRCAWCGKGLGGTDWVRITLLDGKTSFRLCHACTAKRNAAHALENWKIKL